MERKELEYKQLTHEEKERAQQERVRLHAQTTQDLYDDIHKTLKEKFQVEQKAPVRCDKLREVESGRPSRT